jgi:hypothetical protein
MGSKNLGLILSAVGLVGVLVSTMAEPLGIGRDNGFGPRQLTGAIVGALVLLIGMAMAAKAPKTA